MALTIIVTAVKQPAFWFLLSIQQSFRAYLRTYQLTGSG
jgi:hypothetical protein